MVMTILNILIIIITISITFIIIMTYNNQSFTGKHVVMLRVGPRLDLRDNTTCHVFNDFRWIILIEMMIMMIAMIITMIVTMMMIFSANQLPFYTSTQRPLLRALSLKTSLTALLSEIAHTGKTCSQR